MYPYVHCIKASFCIVSYKDAPKPLFVHWKLHCAPFQNIVILIYFYLKKYTLSWHYIFWCRHLDCYHCPANYIKAWLWWHSHIQGNSYWSCDYQLSLFCLENPVNTCRIKVITDQHISHFNTKKLLQKGLCIEFHSWFRNCPVEIPSIRTNQRGGSFTPETYLWISKCA